MQRPLTTVRDPVRLGKRRRLAVYGVGGGLWLTGVAWLIFHYFLVRKTAFGPSPHPLEHWWLSLHGLFAFATLWMFGLLWGRHIVGGWKSGGRRVSGSLLFLALSVLTATGYLLYYPPNESLLPPVALLHWTVGLVLVIPFVAHRFLRTRSASVRSIRASQAAGGASILEIEKRPRQPASQSELKRQRG
jgi:hypothetical protein